MSRYRAQLPWGESLTIDAAVAERKKAPTPIAQSRGYVFGALAQGATPQGRFSCTIAPMPSSDQPSRNP